MAHGRGLRTEDAESPVMIMGGLGGLDNPTSGRVEVGGVDITTTVYPFLLRGVTLAGIDSAGCPGSLRAELWGRLADVWALDGLDEITHEVTLDQLEESIALMRDGDHVGRTIVRLGNND